MAEPLPSIRFEQPRSSFGAWLGVVLLFVIFGFFVWVVVGAMPRGDHYEEQRAQVRLKKLQTLHEEMAKDLNGYAWVDKAKGSVRVPIERAMELSAAELAQKKPAPAGPIATPAAPATAPAGPAAAPVASPGPQAAAPAVPTPAPTATPPSATNPTPHPALTGKDSEMGGQATGSANPPNAAPGTQPGPSTTPAASPASRSEMFRFDEKTGATPAQSSAGTPLPVRGATPNP